MAALGSTIAAEDLALAGITGDLSTALLGLTWSEAKAKLSAVIGLSAGNETLIRGGTVTVTIGTRTVNVTMEQLTKGLAAMRAGLSAASSTGGITALPIEWTDA
jgi:hypothetical protein